MRAPLLCYKLPLLRGFMTILRRFMATLKRFMITTLNITAPVKKFLVSLFSIAGILGASLSYAGPENGTDENAVILAGHDAVAYFQESTAVLGNAEFTSVYKNAIYRFKSADNRDAFNANPAKYAPQYGGFCALGAAYGKKFDVDGKAFKVVDGKLYVNKNLEVAETWVEDEAEFISDANSKWAAIEAVPAADL